MQGENPNVYINRKVIGFMLVSVYNYLYAMPGEKMQMLEG